VAVGLILASGEIQVSGNGFMGRGSPGAALSYCHALPLGRQRPAGGFEQTHHRQPRAPSDHGVLPARTHPTKCSHSNDKASRNSSLGAHMSPVR